MDALSRSLLSTAEPYQLQAQVHGSEDPRVEWSGPGISGSGLFESKAPGTFTVVVRPLADLSQHAETTLRVVARPSVESFRAEPATITVGESTRLSWTVADASEVRLDGEIQTADTVLVTPQATQSFGLEVTNLAGLTVESSAAVVVIAAPKIEAFSADRPALTEGEQTVLRWTSSAATELRLDGQIVTSDEMVVSPQTSRDYMLEARNALGFRVARTLRIEVGPRPQILAFYSDALLITSGQSTTVHWLTVNASQLRLDGIDVTGTQSVLTLTASADHVLEARNAAGFAVVAVVHVGVVPAAVIQTFTADAPTLTEGESTTLRWAVVAASEVRLNGVLRTGTSFVIAPTSTADWVLEAKNAAGDVVARTVHVTVVPAPAIVTFAADASSVTAGQSTTLRWTTTAAAEVRLGTVPTTGTSQSVTPLTTTDFVLQASNAAGFTVTRTVHVIIVPAPIILTFTADAAALTAADSTTLRWTTTGSVEVRLDGVLTTAVTSLIAPTVSGTHTLEVKNALGFTASQTVSVAVVPAAVITSFTLARAALTQSESTLLGWSVTGTASLLVNGLAVSGSSLAVFPSTTTLYTLEARNSLGSPVTASVTLTVVPQVALNFAGSPTNFVVGSPSTLSWTAVGATTLTLNGTAISGTSLTVSPIRSTTYELKATNTLGFETSQSVTLTVSPYPGTIWFAAGQVWLRWTDPGPLIGTQTYDVYRSTSPITTLATATLVGRLLPEDVRAFRLKLADPNATWTLPLASGATTTLAPNEAHFTWTPRTAEISFFAVVRSGNTTPQVRFGPIDETLSAVNAHLQRTGIDGASGLAYSDYALWLDGRAGAATGRADFPVMGPASFNGLATIFRTYASPTPGVPMPGLLMLHGSGGSWLDHHPAASSDGPDVRLSKGVVAALDDAFAYASGAVVMIGTTRWLGSWDGYDRFNNTLSLPPNTAVVHPYTLRRVLWIREWLIANQGVDPDRVLIAGHSMGALGAVTLTRAFPDKFAATLSYQCHTHVVAGFGDYLRGTEAQNLPTSLGPSIVDLHDPAVLLASTDLPPMHFIWGSNDTTVPWADKPATLAQFSAEKRGHQVWWDERTHGYAWAGHFVGSVGLRAESLLNFKRNQSYPAFSAEVSPDTNTSLPWGTQGGYLEWDPASISETAAQWSVELWLRGTASLAADLPSFSTLTVDVSLRRPQLFFPTAGTMLNWTLRRSSDNALLQSGTLNVSSAGLVTASGLVIPKDPQRVRLSVGP